MIDGLKETKKILIAFCEHKFEQRFIYKKFILKVKIVIWKAVKAGVSITCCETIPKKMFIQKLLFAHLFHLSNVFNSLFALTEFVRNFINTCRTYLLFRRLERENKLTPTCCEPQINFLIDLQFTHRVGNWNSSSRLAQALHICPFWF